MKSFGALSTTFAVLHVMIVPEVAMLVQVDDSLAVELFQLSGVAAGVGDCR